MNDLPQRYRTFRSAVLAAPFGLTARCTGGREGPAAAKSDCCGRYGFRFVNGRRIGCARIPQNKRHSGESLP